MGIYVTCCNYGLIHDIHVNTNHNAYHEPEFYITQNDKLRDKNG